MESSAPTDQSTREQNEHENAPAASDVTMEREAEYLSMSQQQEDRKRRPQVMGAPENEEQEGEGEEAASCEDPSGRDSDSASSEEEQEEEAAPFATDEEANEARAVGLSHYNRQRYEDALDIQYRVVRHFEKKYGATAPICGVYFLDYGLSQLRVLQSKSTVEAALQPLDQDALEACFINLDVARVCFQKQEEQRGEGDIEVQLRLAEVHDSIAQLHVEREDFDSALKEYESELLTYRFIQQEAPQSLPYRSLAAVLYGIADCYMKEGDFEGAEERFTAALEELATFPAGAVPAELVKELEELREDAREMKGGKYKELQECIQAQFAVKEAEALPTAQEFYGEDAEDEESRKNHPYVSRLPAESEYSALSMPQSLTNPVQWNEHSNSMSLSLFPPQVNGRGSEASNSQPLHHVVARRKPKRPLSQQPSSHQQQGERGGVSGTGEPEAKRVKTESCIP
ncbi:uncharacterized protein Tco025E_02755 [Trypanosoma conorhini]|uniref:Tetratricopeptide repeat-containing protein n=1 Tax=Trypanosoma conorhini TaxID=83891 RepID=A0A3R7NLR2_9TRYP|nr:uncharacterized protein Tco025E_02755 [Trypanosoma conorhini]RNF23782.1 hypothetical protein Tco025E_02755 [Trypanosoma conorhini]